MKRMEASQIFLHDIKKISEEPRFKRGRGQFYDVRCIRCGLTGRSYTGNIETADETRIDKCQ